MLEGVRHAVDLHGARAWLARSRHALLAAVTSAMIARAGANPTEIARRGFEQVVRTGSLVKVGGGRQHQLLARAMR